MVMGWGEKGEGRMDGWMGGWMDGYVDGMGRG